MKYMYIYIYARHVSRSCLLLHAVQRQSAWLLHCSTGMRSLYCRCRCAGTVEERERRVRGRGGGRDEIGRETLNLVTRTLGARYRLHGGLCYREFFNNEGLSARSQFNDWPTDTSISICRYNVSLRYVARGETAL